MAATGIKAPGRQIRGTWASSRRCGGRAAWVGPDAPVAGFDRKARRRIRLGADDAGTWKRGTRPAEQVHADLSRGRCLAARSVAFGASGPRREVVWLVRWASPEGPAQHRNRARQPGGHGPGPRARGDRRPVRQSKDLVTGSLIVEAVSLEYAVDVARRCPTYEFGGSVEVRPVQDPGSEARGQGPPRCHGAGQDLFRGVRAPGQRADPGPDPASIPLAKDIVHHALVSAMHAWRFGLRGTRRRRSSGPPQPGDRHHPPGTAPPLVPARAGDNDGAGGHDRGGTGPGRRERQRAGDDVRGVRSRA